MRVRSVKFRGGRVPHGPAVIASSLEAEVLPPRTTLRDEPDSNESTQDVGGAGAQEGLALADIGQGQQENDRPSKKRGRGPAKGTLFDRLRKVGKIPLVIQEGHRGPSCENASIFTGRLTWIIKVHADMRHASWSLVPEDEKQELIDRVRADFVLDWSRDNHCEMVVSHLGDKYNAYHYTLHKRYLKYASHEEVVRGGTDMVSRPVWEKLCERWASPTFKEKSKTNSSNRKKLKVKHTGGRKSFIRILEEKRALALDMIAFYKETHWSTRKGQFINADTEHKYNLMVERLAEKDSEEDVVEAAESIFKEVLGQRSGYAQGMGHMVIPDPSPAMKNSRAFIRLAEENQCHKSKAEMYKSKLDQMMGDIAALRQNFSEHEKLLMSYRQSELERGSESHRETHEDA
ncbi:hypothetical protein I3760_03G200600 [Carya illinoinensis]|nr:hypothetical protein I3760_03G200600 [Carya illinoinensis]